MRGREALAFEQGKTFGGIWILVRSPAESFSTARFFVQSKMFGPAQIVPLQGSRAVAGGTAILLTLI